MKEFFIRRDRSDAPPGSERRTLIRIDDEGVIVFADHHSEAVLGYDASELEGRKVQCILAARQDDPFAPSHRHRIENGESILITFRHKEGFFFTADLSLRMDIRDSDQAASARISQRDHSPVDQRLIRMMETSANLGLWELDVNNNELTWTDGMYHLLELRPGSEITPEQALFYCQSSQGRIRARFRRCIRSGQPFSLTLDLLTARQNIRRVKLTGRALKTGERIQRLGGTLIDQTQEQRQQLAIRRTEQLLGATTSATSDLVVAVDRALNLMHFNQAFCNQFELTFGQKPQHGNNLNTLLQDYPNERRLIERLWTRAFERESFVVEMPLAQQNRELPLYEIHYQRLTNETGEVIGAVHVARDISERLQNASNSEYRIQHDPVTGLMNRKAFLARLQRTLEHKPRREGGDSLLYLDLDGFDHFNEIAGSGTCDRYLRELAGNLGVKVRQRDALARLAGDTFALLIENCPEARARKIAESILELIEGFVFHWKERNLQTTASGGLLFLDGDSPANPEQLLAQAADLCHTAKTSGRNRIHAGPAMSRSMDEGSTNEVLEKIRQALDNGQVRLEFQSMRPVASVTWGDHIEILARIPGETPDSPPLTPDAFLPVAERFDLAKRLDRQVIRQTLAWMGQHRLLEPRLKYCGFNLSLASVLDDTFADFMEDILKDSPFAPGCFCLEIREAHATQYPDDVAVLCDTLHRVGCRVALDGAGASVESYSLAAKLPVDIIKLDHKIMQHLNDDPVQQVMVEALHKIAAAAGKVTVATFIENDDTLRKVRTLGIHYGQGFRLYRPRPLEELAPAEVALTTGKIGG
ncbi:EAL domain-containing protein [Marinobacter sp. TBZ242]|uniref:EAL domain-containing protein n=1 Tax=Marinobacter azerbaijanicus TaxID=3050455 RepID=A0ABT7IDZ5_9GAMM|nr:EAL domain-containing protein [Marinobacter sp. TBZ242]MDL0432383.1 EAL domain-containing protein [Marinobacter sp. TBZ242]